MCLNGIYIGDAGGLRSIGNPIVWGVVMTIALFTLENTRIGSNPAGCTWTISVEATISAGKVLAPEI